MLVDKRFDFFEGSTNIFFQVIQKKHTKRFSQELKLKVRDFTPNGKRTGTAFGKKNMNVRIPLKRTTKSVKNTNEPGSKILGFIELFEHVENTVSNSPKKTIKKRTVFTKKESKLFWNGENTMSVRGANEFKGHSSRAFDRIQISTRSTKTAFVSERNEFKLTAMFATIKSKAIFGITTMKHFIDIFKNGITNRSAAISNCIEMVIEDLL